MRTVICLLFCFSLFHAQAQKDTLVSLPMQEKVLENDRVNESSGNIQFDDRPVDIKRHKKYLKLSFVVDSVIIGNRPYSMSKQFTNRIKFETGYLHIRDDVYIKIFVARNGENNKLFYSWKWDYYKKEGMNYRKIGSSFYSPLSYKSDYYYNVRGMGQGIGVEESSDYIMVYYRYRLE